MFYMQADSVFCIGIQHATEEAANANKDYFNLQLEAGVHIVCRTAYWGKWTPYNTAL